MLTGIKQHFGAAVLAATLSLSPIAPENATGSNPAGDTATSASHDEKDPNKQLLKSLTAPFRLDNKNFEYRLNHYNSMVGDVTAVIAPYQKTAENPNPPEVPADITALNDAFTNLYKGLLLEQLLIDIQSPINSLDSRSKARESAIELYNQSAQIPVTQYRQKLEKDASKAFAEFDKELNEHRLKTQQVNKQSERPYIDASGALGGFVDGISPLNPTGVGADPKVKSMLINAKNAAVGFADEAWDVAKELNDKSDGLFVYGGTALIFTAVGAGIFKKLFEKIPGFSLAPGFFGFATALIAGLLTGRVAQGATRDNKPYDPQLVAQGPAPLIRTDLRNGVSRIAHTEEEVEPRMGPHPSPA
jgi:hypothetical protein